MPKLVEIGLVKEASKCPQNIFPDFAIISPWEKAMAVYFNKTEFPSVKGQCFVQRSVKIGLVVLQKKMKMWKVHRQTDRGTDIWTNGKWSKSSLKLSALWCIYTKAYKQNNVKLSRINVKLFVYIHAKGGMFLIYQKHFS